jgi:cobalt-zinc-cadmium efflux system outer membrane protein
VQWNQGTEADRAAVEAVNWLLQGGLTAEEAVQVALVNNRTLRATYEDLGVAQADLVQAGLLRNPVFEGVFRFVRNNGQAYDLGVTQDFLDVLLIPMRKKVARARLEGTKLRVTAAVIDLASEVRIAFVRAQAAEQALAMRRTAMDAARASHQMAQRLRTAGNITALELSLQQELYETSKLNVQAAETTVLETRERLNMLLGLWGEHTEWRIEGALPPVPTDEMNADDVERKAIANSLDLAMAWEALRTAAARMGVRVAEAVSPELAVGLEAEGEDPGTWEVGPALALPIPLFDQGRAASARAKARMRGLWNDYTQQAVHVRSAARTARYRLLAARQRAIYYRDVVLPLRRRILRQTHLRYNAMFLGVFQLLQAKQLEVAARRRYIDELANYWTARVELETLLQGRMVESDGAGMSPEMAPTGMEMMGGGH